MSKEVRSQKLDSVARCLNRISQNIPISPDDLKKNLDQQDILILNLERLVQSSVDCAAILIADRGWLPLPDSMTMTFEILCNRNIISKALAERLSKAVGFRNLCVHEYDKLNWEIVYRIVTIHIDEFREFASIMNKLD